MTIVTHLQFEQILQKKVVMAFACTTQMSAFYYGTKFAVDAAANYSYI